MDLAQALELATDLRRPSRLLADLPLTFTTVPDKSAGDIYTEAMWDTYTKDNLNAGVWRAIAETTIAIPTSTIDFQSIPTTFSHLAVVAYLRGDVAATGTNLLARLNNDATAVYDQQTLTATATTVAASEALAATSARVGAIPGSTAPANAFGGVVITLPHYQSAAWKPLIASGIQKTLTTTGGQAIDLEASLWKAVAVINRLTLMPASGNFVLPSRATLIGIPN